LLLERATDGLRFGHSARGQELARANESSAGG
jgi:hypothetical protein